MTIPTAPGEALGHEDAALVALGRALISGGYRFTTVTPETHRRVLARRTSPIAADLADIFGWSCPFDPLLPPPEMLALMDRAGILQAEAGLLRARIRCSTLGNQLFVHSAYPTTAADAVFFGPDTYRFVRALLPLVPVDTARIVDIGAGSGAGGLAVAAWLGNGAAVVLGDINDAALRFAAVNAAINGLANVACRHSDVLDGIEGTADLIIANPPYLVDAGRRRYRHGGGDLGAALSVRIAEQAAARLNPGGRLVLYTGSAIVGGHDAFRAEMVARLAGRNWHYEEIDPDVFGEELETAAYGRADRIAAVLMVVTQER